LFLNETELVEYRIFMMTLVFVLAGKVFDLGYFQWQPPGWITSCPSCWFIDENLTPGYSMRAYSGGYVG
jgi:hypothetical protein